MDINRSAVIVAAIGTLAGIALLVACEDGSGSSSGGFTLDDAGFSVDGTTSDSGVNGGDACADSDEMCRLRASVSGILLEIPCGTGPRCTTDVKTVTRTVDGEPGASYDVTLHVSGVVELRRYDLGANPDGGAYAAPGSAPLIPAEGYSIDSFAVSAPSQLAYLNAGPIVSNCSVLDYTFTIRLNQGATVTIASDPVDGAQAPNTGDDGGALLAPPHSTTPFNGQFVQIDFVSATKNAP